MKETGPVFTSFTRVLALERTAAPKEPSRCLSCRQAERVFRCEFMSLMLFHPHTEGTLGGVRKVSVSVKPLTAGEVQQRARAGTCPVGRAAPLRRLFVFALVWTLPSPSCLPSCKAAKQLSQIVAESQETAREEKKLL